MFCLLTSLFGVWWIVAAAAILYLLIARPNKWILDVSPALLKLPLPASHDNLYVRSSYNIDAAEEIFPDAVKCPKSLSIDDRGDVWTGTVDGKVVRIRQHGMKLSCYTDVHDVREIATDAAAGAIGAKEEDCSSSLPVEVMARFDSGRPLGMRYSRRQNRLYFIEANTGLYSIDLATNVQTLILNIDECRFLDGRPSKFFDDLAIVERDDGGVVVYITDVSRKFTLAQWSYAFLEPDVGGRILRFDTTTRVVSVVLENLCFPNGIEVTHDGRALLICELAKRRIVRHALEGRDVGCTRVLVDNLPGEPENIRKSPNGTSYWIGLALSRDYREHSGFLEYYGRDPYLRKLILRTTHLYGTMLGWLADWCRNDSWKCAGNNLKTGIALIADDFGTRPGMGVEISECGDVLLTLTKKTDMTVISEIQEIKTRDGNRRLLLIGSSGGPMKQITIDTTPNRTRAPVNEAA